MRAEEELVKWKGRFLLIAFLLFIVGAIFDAVIELNEITIIVIRLILIFSAIGYYLGFFLPDRIAQILGVK
jgi:flagellar biosynthesis protein FliQ